LQDPNYFGSSFLGFQHALGEIVATHYGGHTTSALLKNLNMQRFPYPEVFSFKKQKQNKTKHSHNLLNTCFCFTPYSQYRRDYFMYDIQFGFPVLLLLALFVSVLRIVRCVQAVMHLGFATNSLLFQEHHS
jgi:hypothetical protein